VTRLTRIPFTITLLVSLLLTSFAYAKAHRKRAAAPGQFSFYLLALSYAPDFCSQANVNKDPRECGRGRHIGFVVHGLWPQNDTSRGPENCGPASPVSQAIIQATLPYIPTESLIQHEWATHGTCSGLSAADFFAAVRKARDSVKLPNDLNQPSQTLNLSPQAIERELSAANPKFPAAAFRTSCYRDVELQEVRVCFNKSLSPQACTSSVGECPDPSETLLPVQ
jgi:ribonuclease T2